MKNALECMEWVGGRIQASEKLSRIIAFYSITVIAAILCHLTSDASRVVLIGWGVVFGLIAGTVREVYIWQDSGAFSVKELLISWVGVLIGFVFLGLVF